ncbi:MAG: Holliday junction resolvase RuvX, partial [Acidobacteriota bacterium]
MKNTTARARDDMGPIICQRRPFATLPAMRLLGVDVGRRRIGLAISDDSGMLARPWQTVTAGASPADSAAAIALALTSVAPADDLFEALSASRGDPVPVGAIVVGLPKRLNGDDNEQTANARQVAAALRLLVGVDVHLQDERLTSHEAESRLAVNERDWRKRKLKLD